jgi:deoxyribonuclease-4
MSDMFDIVDGYSVTKTREEARREGREQERKDLAKKMLSKNKSIDEIIELCKIDDILYPVVDFGHLYARYLGKKFLSCDDFKKIFDEIGEKLSDYHAKYLHCHFSKIEYTQKGEKKHLTFEDKIFGPEFEPLGKVIAENNLYPNIICESAGTMDIDAIFMKNTYFSFIAKQHHKKLPPPSADGTPLYEGDKEVSHQRLPL